MRPAVPVGKEGYKSRIRAIQRQQDELVVALTRDVTAAQDAVTHGSKLTTDPDENTEKLRNFLKAWSDPIQSVAMGNGTGAATTVHSKLADGKFLSYFIPRFISTI